MNMVKTVNRKSTLNSHELDVLRQLRCKRIFRFFNFSNQASTMTKAGRTPRVSYSYANVDSSASKWCERIGWFEAVSVAIL